jgi:hypothetical protein
MESQASQLRVASVSSDLSVRILFHNNNNNNNNCESYDTSVSILTSYAMTFMDLTLWKMAGLCNRLNHDKKDFYVHTA